MTGIPMLSIRTRIVVASSVVFALVLAALAVGILRSFENTSIAALDAQMQRCAAAMESELEEQKAEEGFPRGNELRHQIPAELSRAQFRLVDTVGTTLLADSLIASLPVEPWESIHRNRHSVQFATLDDGRFRSAWWSVDVEDGEHYALQIIAPLTEVASAVNRLRTLFIVAVPIALLLLGVATSLIIKRSFRPISNIVDTANRINARDLTARIPPAKNNDEIAALTRTLNAMIERLHAAFAAQKQFIADLSHEYGTPLTILRSELEFASTRVNDADAQRSIHLGFLEIDRLKRMTDDLLLLSRLDSSEQLIARRPVRLDELLAESCRRMASLAAERSIALNLQIDEVCELEGDADRLQRAVANLLDNAIKYSPAGSTVAIHLGHDDSTVRIAVADQGKGILADELPRIFDRFQRGTLTRTEEPGAGLGLAIVRRIVELHGGRVVVESIASKGSTFRIEFPNVTAPS
jgi:two-component system, OmpR family, sensor kinase